MITLGITGGIGSGKSFVSQHFTKQNIPYYNCDERSKLLTNTNTQIINELTSRFGTKIYNDGKLNKALLAQIIFNDKNELLFINNLIHPIVKSDFEQWRDTQNAPFVVVESAILIESGFYRFCDKILVVEAPLELRIKRVAERDKLTQKQVQARIKNQISDAERRKFANFVIVNDGITNIANVTNEIIEHLRNK